jgi:hypothetical protein
MGLKGGGISLIVQELNAKYLHCTRQASVTQPLSCSRFPKINYWDEAKIAKAFEPQLSGSGLAVCRALIAGLPASHASEPHELGKEGQ